MMLVHLPAMDAVTVPSLSSLPSLSSVVPTTFSSSFATIAHILARSNVWLVLLASLVILSSIRAALLYVRPPPSTAHKKAVSLVQLSQGNSTVALGTGTGKLDITTTLSPSPSAPTIATEKTRPATSASVAVVQKKQTSWLWGLVKWDSLPALPLAGARRGGLSMSETERGRWQAAPQLQMQQRGRQQRRPPLSFDQPLPALYQSEVPVSMAKMIMSRHTFRRPTARPPPVRSTSVPQYQRRTPSMV